MSDREQETTERVKKMLADLTEHGVWADVDLLARNISGVSESEVGEVIAELQSGERAAAGDTVIIREDEDGTEWYQFEPADAQPA